MNLFRYNYNNTIKEIDCPDMVMSLSNIDGKDYFPREAIDTQFVAVMSGENTASFTSKNDSYKPNLINPFYNTLTGHNMLYGYDNADGTACEGAGIRIIILNDASQGDYCKVFTLDCPVKDAVSVCIGTHGKPTIELTVE